MTEAGKRCLFCALNFAGVTELKMHCAEAHPDSMVVACKEVPCGCIFSSDSDLRSHLATAHCYHHCPQSNCHKLFKYRNKLKAHLRNFHRVEDEDSPDRDLNAALSKLSEDYSSESRKRPTTCMNALREVLRWWSSEPHLTHRKELKIEPVKREDTELARPRAQKLACNLCAASFASESLRARHLAKVHRHKSVARPADIHKCVFLECPETFASKDELLFHIKTLH